MTEHNYQLDPWDVLNLLVQTFMLAGLCVSGTLLMFSNASCDVRVAGTFIGVVSGCLLLLWVAVAQTARYVSERVAAQKGEA